MDLLKHIKSISEPSASHFGEEFGVNMVQENNLYQFKYMQLSAKWDYKLTHESRGVILRKDGSHWRVASRPFDKFFNQHEGHCPVFDEDQFKALAKNMEFHEKADGTCIQMWYDDEQDKWRSSTLGTITPSNVGDEPYTFAELFWKTAQLDSVLDDLDKEATYVFELCADANRIVTKYENDHCVLLGIRNKLTGEFDTLDGSLALTVCEGTNVRLPHRTQFADLGIKTLADAKAFVEEAKHDEKYGEWPEGFVIYANGSPLAKMKNTRYVELHAVGGGDIKHSKNRIIEAYFHGNLDDFYVMLSDRLKAFADGVQETATAMINKVMGQIATAQKGFYPDQKAYALMVTSTFEGPFRSFMFQNKEAVMAKDPTIRVKLEAWLADNYGKFNWKY